MARVGRSRPRITWTGGITRQTGNTKTFGAAVPALGPAPPQIITPLPTQQMQTVLVQTVAVTQRRSWNRRFALQNQEQDPVKGLATAPTAYGVLNARTIGPQPPQVILPLPTLAMMTLAVSACAVRVRLTFKQRMPLQGYEGDEVKGLSTSPTSYGVMVGRRLGPAPPQIILPLPTQAQQTVAVMVTAIADRIARKRRRPVWFETPTLLAQPPPVVTTVQVTLAAPNRRGFQRRQVQHNLYPPQVVLPLPTLQMQTVAVFLAVRERLQRRTAHYLIEPPMKVLPLPTLGMQTIRATLAATKARLLHKPVHSTVVQPATLKASSPVVTTLAVSLAPRNRGDRVRRQPRYAVHPPTVVSPAVVVTARLRSLIGYGL